MGRVYVAKNSGAEQIKDRIWRGADSLEFQIHDNFGDWYKGESDPHYKGFIDNCKVYTSVHSRLSSVLNCEADIMMRDGWTEKAIREAFQVAEDIGSASLKSIGVVVHTGLGYRMAEKLDIFNETVDYVRYLLNRYSYTEIWIENGVAPVGKYCTMEDKSEVITRLRKALPFMADRIHSVFDTTHAMGYARIMSGCEHRTVESMVIDSFKAFAPTCKEIHFANCIDFGETHEKHGVDFDENSKEDMKQFDFLMGCIDKYMPSSLLCIEVAENDYASAEHFSHIRSIIEKRSGEKTIAV